MNEKTEKPKLVTSKARNISISSKYDEKSVKKLDALAKKTGITRSALIYQLTQIGYKAVTEKEL